MSIKVRCPNPECGRVGNVPQESMGRVVRCPSCGIRFTPSTPGNAAVSPSVGPLAPVTVPLEMVGRYQLQEKLGSGAFGTVYRAYDPQLDREVALKLLHPEALASPQAVERFRREARAAARMQHPHIVPVYDAGE